MGRSPKLDNLIQKPRVLAGTFLGTFACYALFVKHYGTLKDENTVWVWFGMRSDARCGRDFLTEWGSETKCAIGQCCSSHGWCGHGEEYCSASLGCQNGCWAATKADDGDADDGTKTAMPDDDEYADRMHHYRYDDDYGYRRHYGRRYGGYHHHDDPHEYHHRYDDDDHHHDYGGHHEDHAEPHEDGDDDADHDDGHPDYGDDHHADGDPGHEATGHEGEGEDPASHE